uniref:Methyltransferase n=1 Tax=Rhizoctonia cerealis hypovirus TaxID=3068667 RepID=A0AA51GGS8_9VIRU|nr:MAG: hypothetical protein [Rhizoctonia cerealis hypovirus]
MFATILGFLTATVSTYFAIRGPTDDRDKPTVSTPLMLFTRFLQKLGVWANAPAVVTTEFTTVETEVTSPQFDTLKSMVTPVELSPDTRSGYEFIVEQYITNPSPFMSLLHNKPNFDGPNILGYPSLNDDISDISKWLKHVPFQGDVIDIGAGFGRLENNLHNHKAVSAWYGIDSWVTNNDWGNELRMIEAVRTKQKTTTYYKGDAGSLFPLIVMMLKQHDRPISFINIDGDPRPSSNISMALQAYDALTVGGIMCMTICQNTSDSTSNYVIQNHDYINSTLFIMSLLRYRVKLLPQYSNSKVRFCFQKLKEPDGGNWGSTQMWGDPCCFDMFQMIGEPCVQHHQLTNVRYLNFMTLGGRTEKCVICGRSVEVGHHDGWYEEACRLLGDCVPERTHSTAPKPQNL